MIRIVAIYPNTAGSRFDGAYYADQHTALARSLLEPLGLLGVTTLLGEATLDGAPPPFWAISEMHFPTREVFDSAMTAVGEALFADLPNYTDTAPVLQIGTAA